MEDHQLIIKYFGSLTEKQQKQFAELKPLYEDWNSKINVISRKDMDHFYERHVLHSLGIAKVISFRPATTVLDVGTGGGFPGIPLAILFPEVHFHLIDSIGKKIKIVEEIAYALKLTNVAATQVRAEHVTAKYDFVVSRAVTRMKPFYEWVKNSIKEEGFNDLPNGILYLKGGDLKAELKEAKKKYTLYELSEFFNEEFFQTKKTVHIAV
ncbi:MAG: 16S rRNA (guanine(527)-N(7))-methyltransferase RsmG [Candidatus Cyclobacteriaceae bacterium M2_1C_046]